MSINKIITICYYEQRVLYILGNFFVAGVHWTMRADNYSKNMPQMSHECVTCKKTFGKLWLLKRHQEKKIACTFVDGDDLKCICGKHFTTRQSKKRHQRTACRTNPNEADLRQQIQELVEAKDVLKEQVQRLGAPTLISQVNIVNQFGNNNVGVVAAQQATTLGWPIGWRVPASDPQPFEPPTFTLSSSDLEAAARAARPHGRDMPQAASTFLVELTRRIHSDPENRNIYPNPNREDQVLTFQMKRWKMRELAEAMQVMYGRLGVEMQNGDFDVSEQTRALAKSVHSRLNDEKLFKVSRPAFSAHLHNLRVAVESGEDWLGEGLAVPKLEAEVRPFGHEWIHGHDPQSIIHSIEVELGLEAGTVISEGETAPKMCQVLVSIARVIVRGRPQNLSVVLLSEERAAIWDKGGRGQWSPCSSEEAAERLVSNVANRAYIYINRVAQDDQTPLAQLLPALKERLPEATELVGAELLHSYAAAAESYYLRLPPPVPGGEHHAAYQARALLTEARARRQPPLGLDDAYDLFGL